MLVLSTGSVALASRWIISVDIGREKNTGLNSMPAEWAKSGGRLPFKLEADVLTDTQSGSAEDWVGASACVLRPCDPVISITGFSGAVSIPVNEGGWRAKSGKLRFWLDFPEGSTRGDSAGDVANVWNLAPGVAMQGMDVNLRALPALDPATFGVCALPTIIPLPTKLVTQSSPDRDPRSQRRGGSCSRRST